MAMIRFRTNIFLAFGLLVLYFVFWWDDRPFDSGSHTIDVLKGVPDTHVQDLLDIETPGDAAPEPTVAVSSSVAYEDEMSTSSAAVEPASSSEAVAGESMMNSAVAESTSPAVAGAPSASADGAALQEQFDKEYDALGLKENAGAIYGNTLRHLVGQDSHAGFHAAALTAAGPTTYSNTPPYIYRPYPEYNSKAWAANNEGTYEPCKGPDGVIMDVGVFSGHPEIFEEPLIGSYVPLDIDSNLCFERETRLGAYGYQDEEPITPMGTNKVEERTDWNTVSWRLLQELCVGKNANRYSPVREQSLSENPTQLASDPPSATPTQVDSNPPPNFDTEGNVRRSPADDEVKDPGQKLHGMPEVKILPKSRTAVLLRSDSNKNYTENDLQNIRSLITELSLRSGGEYTIYLLVKVLGDETPIWSDAPIHATKANLPSEFFGAAIFWNEAMMETFYPRSENDEKFHASEWHPVQKFANDYPQYEYFWNWELDSRYTGHHYNLLEKLSVFAKGQPRKGLWERNERFYIPSIHGPYDSKFRATVEEISGSEAVWGAPRVEGVKPVGPVRPAMDPRDDNYEWGAGEEADYISLAPIFNPVNTTWYGRGEIWGYKDVEDIPRRATVGMHSRCSKKLLKMMDAEDRRGRHIGSEMGPQTVALLHGLKAVFAPIPMFFDRAWDGSSLDKYLNPGPKGVSGSTVESPFSEEEQIRLRFEGSTWAENAVVPRRLFYSWMGWEYRGIGGPEWEKIHGRTCLPPMLLHPIKNVVKPPPDHSSK